MISKRSRWWKKLLKLLMFFAISFAILFVIVFICSLWVWIEWATPDVYTATNIKRLGERREARIEKRLNVEIPESAREIFYYEAGGKDLLIYYSMVLPPEEISKFAEEFIGVPLSEFINVLDEGAGGPILRGPWEEKWRIKSHWFDILDILENEKRHYIYFGRTIKFPAAGTQMVVDLETNRVYLCIYES